MNSRLSVTILIAAGFPFLNSWLGSVPAMDLRWLALPDVLIALTLIGSLRGDPLRLTGLMISILLIILSLMQWLPSGIFPAWVFLLLARVFERSLKSIDGVPIITQVAARAHGPSDPLTPEAMRYTRHLTAAWSVLFMLLSLLGLYFSLERPEREAMIFGNSIAPIIILAFLLTEIPIRRLCLPNQHRTPLHRLIKLLLLEGWQDNQR